MPFNGERDVTPDLISTRAGIVAGLGLKIRANLARAGAGTFPRTKYGRHRPTYHGRDPARRGGIKSGKGQKEKAPREATGMWKPDGFEP